MVMLKSWCMSNADKSDSKRNKTSSESYGFTHEPILISIAHFLSAYHNNFWNIHFYWLKIKYFTNNVSWCASMCILVHTFVTEAHLTRLQTTLSVDAKFKKFIDRKVERSQNEIKRLHKDFSCFQRKQTLCLASNFLDDEVVSNCFYSPSRLSLNSLLCFVDGLSISLLIIAQLVLTPIRKSCIYYHVLLSLQNMLQLMLWDQSISSKYSNGKLKTYLHSSHYFNEMMKK